MRSNTNKFTLVCFIIFSASLAWGKGKFDVSIGQFDFKAKTKTADVTKSNIGVYDLDFRYTINSLFEIGIGYSLLMTGTFGGDMSFGPNFEFIFYPLSFPSKTYLSNENSSFEVKERWRPFGGLSFHQRQFQSIQNSYAGFGFFAGADWWFSKDTGLKFQYRSMALNGPEASTATQRDLSLGMILDF